MGVAKIIVNAANDFVIGPVTAATNIFRVNGTTLVAETTNVEQVLAANGAVSLTAYTTRFTDGTTYTLANGTYNGQIKNLVNSTGTAVATTTPTTFGDGTNIVLTAKFDSCKLEWQGTWRVLSLTGTAAIT